MATIRFLFDLDTRHIKHLKEKSVYNHNYYELDLRYYGDYIIPRCCNILYEECDDVSEEAYYSLGFFDEKGEFQPMWTWLDNVKYEMYTLGAV